MLGMSLLQHRQKGDTMGMHTGQFVEIVESNAGLAIAASGVVFGAIMLLAVTLRWSAEEAPGPEDPSALHETQHVANPQDESEEIEPQSPPESRQPMSVLRIWALTALNISYGFMAASQGLLLLPLEAERLFPDRPSLALGLMAASTGAAQLIGPIAGHWSDGYRSRIGRRRPCVVMLALTAWTLTYGLSVCSQLGMSELFVATFFLQQAAWCALFSIQMGVVPDLVPDEQVAVSGGAASANLMVGACGALLISQLLSDLPPHVQYVFISGLTIVCCVLFFIAADEKSSLNLPQQDVSDQGFLWRVVSKYRLDFASFPDFTKLLVSKTIYNSSIVVKGFLMFFMQDTFSMGGAGEERRLASKIAFAAVMCAAPSAVAGSIFLDADDPSQDKRTVSRNVAAGVWRARCLAIFGSLWMGLVWAGPIVIGMSVPANADVGPWMSHMIIGCCIWGLGQGSYLAGDQALTYLLVPSRKEASRYLGFSSLCSTLGTTLGGFSCGMLLHMFGRKDGVAPSSLLELSADLSAAPGYMFRGYAAIFVFAVTSNLLITTVMWSIKVPSDSPQ